MPGLRHHRPRAGPSRRGAGADALSAKDARHSHRPRRARRHHHTRFRSVGDDTSRVGLSQRVFQSRMNVLAICAHPDDETLGCGGTLLKHAAAGDSIFWIVATVCHEPQWCAEVIARKAIEVDRVAAAYGAELLKLGLPNARLDTIATADLMRPLERAIDDIRPE